jgi:hypothetical protein
MSCDIWRQGTTAYSAYAKGPYRATPANLVHCICTGMGRFNAANKDHLDVRGHPVRHLSALAEAADSRSESDDGW